MNDQELDELLDTWTVPPVPKTLRENIQRVRRAENSIPHRRRRRLLSSLLSRSVAAIVVASLLILLLGAGARSQVRLFFSTAADARFTVRSKNVNYNNDGSVAVLQYQTRWQDDDGSVQSLETDFPEEPFRTAVGQSIAWLLWATRPILKSSFREVEETHRRFFTKFVRSGCQLDTPGVVASWRETMLGYETVVYQIKEGNADRTTIWFAPKLSCFALKEIYETKRTDGSFRVTGKKEPLSVDWLAKAATH